MQPRNPYKWQNPNASSDDDSDQGSAPGQNAAVGGAVDASPAGGVLSSQEYLMDASGKIAPVIGAAGNSGASGSGASSAKSSPPAPTLVGSPNGLQFDLIWDASVVSAPRGFMQAVVDAAKLYSTLFSNKAVISIDVGFGEIAGSQLAPGDLGESASFGYLTDYPTVTSVLSADGFAFSAANEPTGAQFFITSADAKAMGLVDPVAGLDGFIGFGSLSGTGFSWNTKGTATGPKQFDLLAVAEHEISEVMGRLGLEGTAGLNTPLDLYNYQSPGVLALSPNGGYFSINNGQFNLGNFNDAAVNGGDIGDWASVASIKQSGTLGLAKGSFDAYDAFAYPGVNGQVSLSDVIEDAALGYTFKTALLGNYVASFASTGGPAGGVAAAQDAPASVEQLLTHS
jgi:hypothetical protein